LQLNQSSRFRRAFSQSSKASSWVSLAEAESLPDPDDATLGAGSCGTVAKVSHKFTGEIFALKAIQQRWVKEKHLEEYVEREVATQKQLKHPNIVKLHEHFEDEEYVYLLLEFAPDGSLYSKIRAQHCLAHAEAASIFVDVSEALVHLHRHGTAHRDLKPENVLLFPGGRAKLADFGWCAQLTNDGRKTFCGTMDYLSPEMVSQQPHDHRVDVWALGVLLYEMLTGDPPFSGRSTAHILERILTVDLIMPVSMPEGAADLIHALLKVDPGERLSLNAALKWPWLQDMRTDPLETDEEMAIPVDAVECTEPLPMVPAAMHRQPQPKSSSRRNSPRFNEGALPSEGLAHPVPLPRDPDCDGKVQFRTKKRSKSKRCFGSALRPYHADWELPPNEAKTSSLHSAHSAQEGFLLSTCLEPASGLQLRHRSETAPEMRESSGSEPVQSWADTDLYTSLRSWVRQVQPAHEFGKDLDEVLGVKATDAEIRTRCRTSSVDISTGSPPQSLSGSSESSHPNWDCTDADASTDMEGEARCLPMAESIHVGGYEMMAPATKARVFR